MNKNEANVCKNLFVKFRALTEDKDQEMKVLAQAIDKKQVIKLLFLKSSLIRTRILQPISNNNWNIATNQCLPLLITRTFNIWRTTIFIFSFRTGLAT